MTSAFFHPAQDTTCPEPAGRNLLLTPNHLQISIIRAIIVSVLFLVNRSLWLMGTKQIFPLPDNAKGAPEVQQLRVSVTHRVRLKPWIFQLRNQSLKSKAYTSTALFFLANPQTRLRAKVLSLAHLSKPAGPKHRCLKAMQQMPCVYLLNRQKIIYPTLNNLSFPGTEKVCVCGGGGSFPFYSI